MLAKLGLVANLYWLSSWFDVEPTQGDKLNGITLTAEGWGWVWEYFCCVIVYVCSQRIVGSNVCWICW